jgi:alkanesulfonate monooxygenase SsuD/methylene tetrahydromethanopterin reductase-like flavin-dependent oxidoreductase (luciferase family)
MKFGLAVGGTTDPKLLEKWAVKAEELGYDCFLVTDHFMGTRTNNHFDVWTFLPYLAAKTRTIRLGTCVTPIPFRPPAIFAKMISTADILSNGRIILGAGSGWFKPEFDGYSRWMGDKERVAFTKEAIHLMIRLWTVEGPVNYKGRFVSANGAVLEPKPVQKPYPEIWFGGHSLYAVNLAGRYGRGWIPFVPIWHDESYPLTEYYSRMKGVIMEELEKRGVVEKDFVFSILINRAEIPKLRNDIDAYVQAGMNYFILGLNHAEDESAIVDIERVAREIGDSLQR